MDLAIAIAVMGTIALIVNIVISKKSHQVH